MKSPRARWGLIRDCLGPTTRALLLSVSFHCRCCILGRDGGIPVAVLARLGADSHQPGGGFFDIPSPIQRRHAPCEVGAADVRAGLAMIRGSTFNTALIVRPPASAYCRFMPA